jgi:hypothetical protein
MRGNTLLSGYPALREGLVFGVILGIISFAANLVHNFIVSNFLVPMLGVLLFIVIIALNLLAGARASRQSGRVGTGALASLIMQLIFSLFVVLSILTELFVFNSKLRQLFQILSPATASEMAQQFIIGQTIYFVIILLVGVMFGAIGGLIGRCIQLPMNV